MQWLAHHSFVLEDENLRKLGGRSFALNGTIYFLFSSNDECSLFRLHPMTLDALKVNVLFENFETQALEIGCVLTNDGSVLMWDPHGRKLYRGNEVENGVSFREIETSGDMPIQYMGFAHGIYNGNFIIHGGMGNSPFFRRSSDTFELNLESFSWRKLETNATKYIRDELSTISYFTDGNLIIGDMMHVIDHFAVRKHFILDLSTNTWTRVEERSNPSIYSACEGKMYGSNEFVCEGKLYLYGRKRETPGIIYRFDEEKAEWMKMLSSQSCKFPECYGRISVVGSRVYLSGNCSSPNGDATLVSVLETNPTLFDSSAAVLQRSREGRELIAKQLPPSVKEHMLQSD
ncbi:hypothetical protein PENTCL1PPCAC_15715 [Pristionchus entomophagus]|uniref:Uncharacterized protein n=1 Tax=Pristionchus entomophagus TaxID=358040 RepID=A0AAV5TGU5_9BILA|nr:hypothetical protein PENTCL1PPCAC_15715 [Pristionchus entomophagus]